MKQPDFYSFFNPKSIHLPYKKVKRIIEENNVEPWFNYIFLERKKRWDLWEVSNWINKNISNSSKILETGCGCGFNLIWLAQHGFVYLYGSDIEANNISAAKSIAKIAKTPITFWIDNSLSPKHFPESAFDVIISLNWTFLLDDYDATTYFKLYSRYLAPNGVFIIDVIDSSYNKCRNNQYKTSEWDLPKNLRSPSEYKKRYSMQQIYESASLAGLSVMSTITHRQTIPKVVYVMKKRY